jgi:hypothetical protein
MTVASSAVTAAAVLGSAALAQRATQTRDQNARLWEQRSEVYVEVVRWLQSLLDALPADDDASTPLTPDFSASPPLLRAELVVYASPEVYRLVQSIVGDGTGLHLSLHRKATSAIDAIREELHGRNPLPYERSEPTRRELFVWWLYSLRPMSVYRRVTSRLAYRERKSRLSQLDFATDRDDPDLSADDKRD